MSINVEYNNKEIVENVLMNIFKMLERRNIIESWENQMKNLDFTKSIFEFIVKDKTKYSINIVNAKLGSIVNGTPLDDYLSNNIDVHKIIIARDVAKKVVKQIIYEYKNAEFFFEYEMLEDIISKVFIPVHQLLNEEEKTELLSKFSEHDLSSILISDMMSRYYGAKLNDIFRIIRPSITAGRSILYRRVVNGSWDILFSIN
jgi:DNA-directed RNA polymerase subunit H (RpoH/RPB5)